MSNCVITIHIPSWWLEPCACCLFYLLYLVCVICLGLVIFESLPGVCLLLPVAVSHDPAIPLMCTLCFLNHDGILFPTLKSVCCPLMKPYQIRLGGLCDGMCVSMTVTCLETGPPCFFMKHVYKL